MYIPFALFTILLKYVRLSQGIRKLCGTAIIPRLTAIHRPINRVSSGRRKIEILKLIETVLVYKFPKLTRAEIEAMFTLNDLKETRVYQDARQEGLQEGRQEGFQEGRQEGELSLVLRQLNRRFGKLSDRLTLSIQTLEMPQIEELADQLLDFRSIDDLDNWFNSQTNLAKDFHE